MSVVCICLAPKQSVSKDRDLSKERAAATDTMAAGSMLSHCRSRLLSEVLLSLAAAAFLAAPAAIPLRQQSARQ